MAKTRSRRGARKNITRRGGGKGNRMQVEKSKARSVKAKPMKHGSKRKTHTIIKKKGVTGANLALNKKQRAEAKAEKYLQKYRAALAAAAAAAAEEEEEDEEDEEEDEEDEEEEDEEEDEEEEEDDDNLDEGEFEKRMERIPPQLVPYAPNALDNNGMKRLMATLEGPAVNNNNSQ